MRKFIDENDRKLLLNEWKNSNYIKMLDECRLCPRGCGAERRAGSYGYCQAGPSDKVRIARAAPHYWEEPCISGEQDGKGSGTIFFAYCTLGCVFCQNRKISRPQRGYDAPGTEIDVVQLTEIFLALEEHGVHNINLVTPTQYVPQIIFAAETARRFGLKIPIVYNTGGYESLDTIKKLKGIVDIYLPDFKYIDRNIAKKYSGAENYPDVFVDVLDEMVKQTGEPVFEGEILKRGTVVRHLILPGCATDARRILKLLHERYGNNILISIMNQYTPLAELSAEFEEKYPELISSLPDYVYSRVVRYAENIGIENAYIQEGGTVSESFIPEFDPDKAELIGLKKQPQEEI